MPNKAYDSITITLPGWDDTEGAEDSIYISSGSSDTITLNGLDSNLVIGGASVTGSNAYPWTTSTSPYVSGTGLNFDTLWSNGTSSKIKLDGNDADIEIIAQYSKDGNIQAFYNKRNKTTYFVADNINKNTDFQVNICPI